MLVSLTLVLYTGTCVQANQTLDPEAFFYVAFFPRANVWETISKENQSSKNQTIQRKIFRTSC
jgi:hypothetical protein